MKSKKKKYIISVIVLVVFIIGAVAVLWQLGMLDKLFEKNSASVKSSGTGKKTIVNESNVESFLSRQTIINDLPKSANIQLIIGEKTYAVAKGEVGEGFADNPDITINVPAKYMADFGGGMCSALKKASKNGDLRYTLHISKVSAGWKYSALYKYKDCL